MKTKTRKTEIAFDAGALVARVEGFAAGQRQDGEHAGCLKPSADAESAPVPSFA